MATTSPSLREVVTMLGDRIHRAGLKAPAFTDADVP
jgi:hypothetical protein